MYRTTRAERWQLRWWVSGSAGSHRQDAAALVSPHHLSSTVTCRDGPIWTVNSHDAGSWRSNPPLDIYDDT